MLVIEVRDLLVVDGRVDLRVVSESFRCSLDEEGQERQLRAVLGQEGVLGACTKSGDLGDVNLNDRGQLSGSLQRLDHAAGNRLTQTRHLLGRAAQRRGLTDDCGLRGGRS